MTARCVAGITGAPYASTVYNLGSAAVDDIVIAVIAKDSRTIARKALGALAAPVDLVPKCIHFTLPLPDPPAKDWRLVVDPDNKVPEIYEGNNEVRLVVTP